LNESWEKKLNDLFRTFAHSTSNAVGTPWAFLIAVAVIVIWAVSGPLFGYSDTWQLVINTGTTIVTFLMVFLIQNTQNRDAAALHLKLDELLRAVEGAREKKFVDLEEKSEEVLQEVKKQLLEQAGSIATEQERVQQDRTQQGRQKAKDRKGQPAAS
jgi:low affinity Fe/Cu permease